MDSPDSEPKPKRRPRYRGTHPRRYDEKYKERNPELYPETVAKVMASGKTPAGMHRPICVTEILEVLSPQPGEIFLDATLGYGGHSRELLRRIQPGGRLIALDVDPIELPQAEARLREEGFSKEILEIRRMNYAGFPAVLAELKLPGVHGVLADLGCSSMQFDNPARGFSFKKEGPLDLRMNPQRGLSAAEYLQRTDLEKLEEVLRENSDEPFAREIATAVYLKRKLLLNTTGLAGVIWSAIPGKVSDEEKETSIRRVFQALRIEINDEFGTLDSFLKSVPRGLLPGGRVAILTFHSGEDRRVKKTFQAGHREGVYSEIAREVIRPTGEEIRANSRASSAKLRWAIRSISRS